MRIPWLFTDPVTLEQVALDTNPHTDNGSLGVEKQTSYAVRAGLRLAHTGPRVDSVVRFGSYGVPTLNFSGNVYSEEELDMWYSWFTKDYPIIIRDDLMREFLVLLQSFEPQRVRSRNWHKHSYSFSAIVLEET